MINLIGLKFSEIENNMQVIAEKVNVKLDITYWNFSELRKAHENYIMLVYWVYLKGKQLENLGKVTNKTSSLLCQ